MRYDAAAFLDSLFLYPAGAGPDPVPAPVPALIPADLLLDSGPLPEDLPADWYEIYDERLALMEVDGKVPLEHLEAKALASTLAVMRAKGVTIPQRGAGR